jgi:hypothetical protein
MRVAVGCVFHSGAKSHLRCWAPPPARVGSIAEASTTQRVSLW